jgi:hypothetical protein
MENPTSFDLNRAIEQWRENLAQSPAFCCGNLDELESHLRDSVAALQTRGLSASEAFLVASRRIGASNALETEFGKVNGQAIWLDRFFWMLIGLQVWGFISGAIGLITRNALFFGLYGAGYDFKAHGYTLSTTLFTLVNLAGFTGSLALCWWLFCRKGQRFGRWFATWLQSRGALALSFGALYLLSLSIGLSHGAMQFLLTTTIGRERIGEIYYAPQMISLAIAPLVTAAIFTWLTLFLARKRFRLRQA